MERLPRLLGIFADHFLGDQGDGPMTVNGIPVCWPDGREVFARDLGEKAELEIDPNTGVVLSYWPEGVKA